MDMKEVVSKFDSLKNTLTSMKAKFCSHPEKDFLPNRKISFS